MTPSSRPRCGRPRRADSTLDSSESERNGGANPLGAGSPDGAAAEGPGGTRDPRLVGHWRKSTSMSGGGFGVVVDEHLYIHADGRFEHGDSKIAGGGPGSGFSGAGGSADNTVGQWSTRGDVVYVQGAGQPTWIPFARFYTDGTSLMFTTGDGQREVWKRVR